MTIEGEKVEAVTDFIFLGSKIIVEGDHSHEIKKTLAPWKESFDKLDSILKSRDTTLPTKVHIIKAMVFPVGHVGIWELDQKEGWSVQELMLLNCGAGEGSWETLRLQGYQPS